MALFFFNVRNDEYTDDYEGQDLADAAAARTYAVAAARSLAADTVTRGHIGLSHCVEIVDASRRLVDRVTFAEAVEIRP